MDYTTQTIAFKVKKVLRYLRLYGLRRTIIKVRGQFHMKRRYAVLPPTREARGSTNAHVGIIGCGNYAFSNIAYYLQGHRKGIIRGVMDVDIHHAASMGQHYGAAYYTNDARRIIGDPHIDLVYIASNHASHAEYAIDCIRAGKHVHVEKPHVVSEEQLRRLADAVKANPVCKVFLGFNRPRSPLFRTLAGHLSREVGPLMINWFVAGHEIPGDHWYFDEKEGGRVLGNLCHWTDLTLQLVGMERAFPCEIVPATPPDAKSDFVVSVVFADQSCASITFSAKGHTFEGVREVLNVHRGSVLANLSDFHSLTVDVVERRVRVRHLFRDHGHRLNIIHSLTAERGEAWRYVHATAKLFLAIRAAIDSGRRVTLSRDEAFGPDLAQGG